MQFWDSSAIVSLLLNENRAPEIMDVAALNDEIAASCLTPLEVASALSRRRSRDGITLNEQSVAEELFSGLVQRWFEVGPVEDVLASALILTSRHHLRAGAAIQLASALIACDGAPAALPFVTLDRDLATAARAEGFPVLP